MTLNYPFFKHEIACFFTDYIALSKICSSRTQNQIYLSFVEVYFLFKSMFCHISLPFILLTISLVFIMAMMQKAIINEANSAEIRRLFCSMKTSG